MTLGNYIVSLIRTVIPVAVGALIVYLAGLGIEVDATALETVLFGVASTGYYALVRALESRWPKVGWLLGYAVRPAYVGTPSHPRPSHAAAVVPGAPEIRSQGNVVPVEHHI